MLLKVLLVDDDKDVRDFLIACIEADGFSVDTADGMETALQLLDSNDYDIMLTDKNMTGINGNAEGGLDLLRYVRERALSTEVILITGYPTTDSAVEAMKLGAFDYIYKPFSMGDLKLKLRRLVKYRSFVNPEYALGAYRRLQGRILQLIEREPAMPDEEFEKAMLSIHDEIDILFAALKESERIVLAERESLANIADLAERMKANLQPTDVNYDLADRICRLSDQRL